MRNFFWKFVHNAIAHPLLVTGTDWSIRFHDWTADRWDEVYPDEDPPDIDETISVGKDLNPNAVLKMPVRVVYGVGAGNRDAASRLNLSQETVEDEDDNP